jgi:hypothetical protein
VTYPTDRSSGEDVFARTVLNKCKGRR